MTFATRTAVAPRAERNRPRWRCSARWDTRGPSITMDLYVHEFETARRREQVGEHLAAALGGLFAVEI